MINYMIELDKKHGIYMVK